MNHSISYLALGDSYTIGESLPLHESFPYLATQLIRKQKISIQAPEIIAKTGWTSSELAEQLLKTELNAHYDFISLLIGVNNQYRHLSLNDFRSDFEYLLKKSIHLANGKPQNVMVLSIPDWGCTPFAKEKTQHPLLLRLIHLIMFAHSLLRIIKRNTLKLQQQQEH